MNRRSFLAALLAPPLALIGMRRLRRRKRKIEPWPIEIGECFIEGRDYVVDKQSGLIRMLTPDDRRARA